MPSFTRRQVLALAGAGALLVGHRTAAHEGHSHGDAATPGASPAPATGTGTGAVYLTLRNTGDQPDRMVSASTTKAREVQIHESAMVDGVMKMQPLHDGLVIAPGSEVVLEPGGHHLMLIDLTEDILPASEFTLELVFELAGATTVTVPVVTAAPEDGETVTLGSIEISNVWSRPAPRLSPVATPAG